MDAFGHMLQINTLFCLKNLRVQSFMTVWSGLHNYFEYYKATNPNRQVGKKVNVKLTFLPTCLFGLVAQSFSCQKAGE
jgi:amino acid permease